MRKLLAIFILCISVLNANTNYELRLYEKVMPTIFKEIPIKIFADKKSKRLLKNSSTFEIVNNCNEAVALLIGSDFESMKDKCKNKPIFSTTYRSFKNTKNSFGAFYWRKGRPQIRFKNDILDKFNLVVPASLKKYAK